MKRLLCLLATMNTGGAETFLMKLYRQLDRTEYQMDFCVNVKEKCFYEDEIISLGGKVFHIPSKSESFRVFKLMLTRLIKEGQYNNVLRITSNCAGFMDLKIAKKAGAAVCSVRSSNSSDGGGLKIWVAHHLGRLLYKKYIDVKIAPSYLAANYTFGKHAVEKGDVHILHNAVDLSIFQYDASKRDTIRHEFEICPNAKVVGHIGRFDKQKNHLFLIDVFYAIHKRDPNTVLMLVGSGDLEEMIRNKVDELGISESVYFTGVRSDIPAVLSAFDVFIFPSFYEGMPNTVIEAQATGLPCLISDAITKESKITDLVSFLSLRDSAEEWADKALMMISAYRINTKEQFILNGYDIKTVVNHFCELVF